MTEIDRFGRGFDRITRGFALAESCGKVATMLVHGIALYHSPMLLQAMYLSRKESRLTLDVHCVGRMAN